MLTFPFFTDAALVIKSHSFNMLLLSVILIVVALATSCDAYAHMHAPTHVGGIATNSLPLLPQRALFGRNDTNSSRVPGVYKLSNLYDYTNFFDKFSFVEVSTWARLTALRRPKNVSQS